jgi:predicted NAD/FAD-dependent oxidoreductase
VRRVAIVGGGVAGLSCARRLVDLGRQVQIFDKGRGPGGRASTRRTEVDGGAVAFDHGAQYFTARTESFRQRVSEWSRAGVVQPWTGRIGSLEHGELVPQVDGPDRFVGTPGMSALVRALGEGLELRHSARVISLARASGEWRVLTEGGDDFGPFDEVVVAVPAPQAMPLLAASAELSRRLAAVTMPPCWAVMAAWAERLPVEVDGAFVRRSSLAWIARDSSKPRRARGERWVLHACPEWSEEHLPCDEDEVVTRLVDALSQATGVRVPEPIHAAAHLWRFARVQDGGMDDCLHDAELGLGACGDWCAGGRIEGAYLSGQALAERLREGS